MVDQPATTFDDAQAKRLLVASNLGFRVHFGKSPDRVDPHLWLSCTLSDLTLGLRYVVSGSGSFSGSKICRIEVVSPAAALDLVDHFLSQAKMQSLIELYSFYPRIPGNS